MASILPVSDLRNYNEVLKNCRAGEPVFLTKMAGGVLWYLTLKTMNMNVRKRNC